VPGENELVVKDINVVMFVPCGLFLLPGKGPEEDRLHWKFASTLAVQSVALNKAAGGGWLHPSSLDGAT